jgi:hypothetical protein
MSGLQVSIQWPTAGGYYFPDKISPRFREKFAMPAVYRWRVMRDPIHWPKEQREKIYIGESEELTRRMQWVLTPHSAAKATDTNRRLNAIFSKLASLGRKIVIDIADVEPFEINGIRFDQRDLGDRFKRRMLEHLLLAIAAADKNFDLLNNVVEPLGRDRELLARRLSPRQVRETKQRYFGSSDTGS